MEVHTLQITVDMSALREGLLTVRTRREKSEQEKDVIERTKDDLMRRLACIKGVNSRRKFDALLYKDPESLFVVSTIDERPI